MANNRLWAVCKADNKCIALLKNYSEWYCIGQDEDHNKFFQEHEDCEGNKGCGENIVFVTELDDKVKLYDFSRKDYPDVRIYLK